VKQLAMGFVRKKRRGKKKGGRPPKNGIRAGVSHLSRPRFNGARFPVHITLRVRAHVWSLRTRRCFTAVRRSFYAGNGRFGLRLTHFNVLGNHLHLICEASNEKSLSKGMQGLEVRIAKALNRVMERKGGVFDDRYHGRVLRTPTEVRHALHYVRENEQKHFGRRGHDYSSLANPGLTVEPATWLLRRAPS
jgi:REP element-mobilizing transposase RayT